MQKIPVAILGASGRVGQKLIALLVDHPYFELKQLCASKRSTGKSWQDIYPMSLPHHLATKKVQECLPSDDISLAFSALDSQVAQQTEPLFLEQGIHVISNSSYGRMFETVPLLIPEINRDHLSLIDHQQTTGKLITNPNCVVAGLTLALKPLLDTFGLEKLQVVSMQAISGVGLNAQLDIDNNIHCDILNETIKVEEEPKKILGSFIDGKIRQRTFFSSAQCYRVPVTHGHLMHVTYQPSLTPKIEDVLETFENFNRKNQETAFYSSPSKLIHYFEDQRLPQPKYQTTLDRGMGVSIGNLKVSKEFGIQWTLLVDNLQRGAAGAALLNAELFFKNKRALFNLPKKNLVRLQ